MIIVDSQKLKFLLAGRPLTVEVHREYRKGRDYAVGKNVRKATCRARIEETERIGERTWRITLRHLVHERPRLLARSSQYGYVEVDPMDPDLHQALYDEPEPVSGRVVGRYSRETRKVHGVRKRTERAELPRTDRIAALELAASQGDQQAKRQLFVIDQRIQQAERKQSRESAA